MVQWFCFMCKNYLMEKYCTCDNGSVWLKDQPCKIHVGQWSIFHGPLIFALCLCHRLKIFLYIKKWRRLGVFVFLRALAPVVHIFIIWFCRELLLKKKAWKRNYVVLQCSFHHISCCCLWENVTLRSNDERHFADILEDILTITKIYELLT